MILRLVRGRVRPGHLQALRLGLAGRFFARAREIAGITNVHVGLRDTPRGDEVVIVTAWTTPDAEMAVLGRQVEKAGSLPGVTEHFEVTAVEHYEVDESVAEVPNGAATVLRIAEGRIELGADVEIQQELRRRLTALGPDVAAAYVGRRIQGRAVEVVLVTVWRRPPDGRPLDEPIWPDIATRYESYWIETYEVVLPA